MSIMIGTRQTMNVTHTYEYMHRRSIRINGWFFQKYHWLNYFFQKVSFAARELF